MLKKIALALALVLAAAAAVPAASDAVAQRYDGSGAPVGPYGR